MLNFSPWHLITSTSHNPSSALRSHDLLNERKPPYFARTTWAQQGYIGTIASIWHNPPLNPTMTQNSSNVEITDGIFIHNHDKGTVNLNSTVVNEQNGMTGASYESVVNR